MATNNSETINKLRSENFRPSQSQSEIVKVDYKQTHLQACLNFVKGSIKKTDFSPLLNHFVLKDGFITGSNGVITLSSELKTDVIGENILINCKPNAIQFFKAIEKCSDNINISFNDKGKLVLKSGKFKVFIDCKEEELPDIKPTGTLFKIDGLLLLNAFKILYPFISDDDLQSWSTGVLLKNNSCFATNNTILIEYWIKNKIEIPINIPKVAIKEIIRINEPPLSAVYDKNSITFFYSGNRWLKTQLLSPQWPNTDLILNKDCHSVKIDPLIFEGLETLKTFCENNNAVYFKGNIIATSDGIDNGASFDLGMNNIFGKFNVNDLLSLKDIATHADFNLYPNPVIFYGDMLRGVITGMKPIA